jgi:hypothetical protein
MKGYIMSIKLTKVESSNIEAVGYIEDREILVVQFKSGATYQYLGVPYYMYEELLSAESAGKYLNSEVKGCYEFERL